MAGDRAIPRKGQFLIGGSGGPVEPVGTTPKRLNKDQVYRGMFLTSTPAAGAGRVTKHTVAMSAADVRRLGIEAIAARLTALRKTLERE